jgi:hypothetical protein
MVENDSPLPYEIAALSTCESGNLSYADPGVRRVKKWSESITVASRPDTGRPERHSSSRKIFAVGSSKDERIVVTVSWNCITNIGNGTLHPMTLKLESDQ